jgi:hypothetical protein
VRGHRRPDVSEGDVRHRLDHHSRDTDDRVRDERPWEAEDDPVPRIDPDPDLGDPDQGGGYRDLMDPLRPARRGPVCSGEQILFTAQQAGLLLAVRGSWLADKAAAGTIPCRRLGKHLRFSRSDLREIADAAAHPAAPTRARPARAPARRTARQHADPDVGNPDRRRGAGQNPDTDPNTVTSAGLAHASVGASRRARRMPRR